MMRRLTAIRAAYTAAFVTTFAASVSTALAVMLAVVAPLLAGGTVLGVTSGDWWLAAVTSAAVLIAAMVALSRAVDAEFRARHAVRRP